MVRSPFRHGTVECTLNILWYLFPNNSTTFSFFVPAATIFTSQAILKLVWESSLLQSAHNKSFCLYKTATHMMEFWHTWKKDSRYSDVFRVCFPLVLGMSATTVMEFTDRLFLANYHIDAISAASPAGIAALLFMSFFGGIGAYSSVFISQYMGAGERDKIGIVLWQAIYFTLLAGALLILISIFAGRPIFLLAGHSPEVRELEEIYFNILCRGAIFHVATQTLAGFFTGQGKTKPVMLFSIVGMAVNIPLDYALIYGAWGLPELGIAGAALATVISWCVTTLLMIRLIFTSKNNHTFQLRRNYGFHPSMFLRMMKFGIPGALQFSLDIFAFTIFILLVGRIGKIELAASNIVIAINSIAFMPAIGVSQGISVLVGQALGRRQPDEARRLTWSSIHLLLIYVLVIDLIFIFAPEILLSLFIPADHNGVESTVLLETGRSLLHIIAAYLLLDSLYMVFSGVLKGAGDTRFVMFSIGCAALFFMFLPVYCGIEYFDFSIQQAWMCVVIFIVVLCGIVSWRYRQGKWEKMTVIDQPS